MKLTRPKPSEIAVAIPMAAIPAAMLIWAIWPHPIWYFQLLRWIVAAFAGLVAYFAAIDNRPTIATACGAIAVIFNPFVPFRFSKQVWHYIDVVAAILIIAFVLVLLFTTGNPKEADDLN